MTGISMCCMAAVSAVAPSHCLAFCFFFWSLLQELGIKDQRIRNIGSDQFSSLTINEPTRAILISTELFVPRNFIAILINYIFFIGYQNNCWFYSLTSNNKYRSISNLPNAPKNNKQHTKPDPYFCLFKTSTQRFKSIF